MPVIHALFDSYIEASRAVRALEARGIDKEDISIIANKSDIPAEEPVKPTAEGAELGTDLGAIAGGAGGLLAGLGVLTIPGIGPVVGAGWLVSTTVGFLAGAASGLVAGGIIGALVDAGVPEDHAHLYVEGIRRGGTLVTARIDAGKVEEADALLEGLQRVDVPARQLEYERDGWTPIRQTAT
jgi:hypothetical protein